MEPKPASESAALLARWMGIGDADSRGNRLAEREMILEQRRRSGD